MNRSHKLILAAAAILAIAGGGVMLRQDAGHPPIPAESPPVESVSVESVAGGGAESPPGPPPASPPSPPAGDPAPVAAGQAADAGAEKAEKADKDSSAAGPGSPERSVAPGGDVVVKGRVEPGDTPDSILDEAGAEEGIPAYLRAARRVFSLRSFRPGRRYMVITDPSGRVKRFEYEIDDVRRLVVEGLDSPVARLENIPLETSLELVEGVIESDLFRAVADRGEDPRLARRIVSLFASEINFARGLRRGDTFSVLVEKRRREGVFRGYGEIPAARFTNRGKTYEAWLFRDARGALRHFNARGESLSRTLLQAPLATTRVTSRFSQSRMHPVLGFSRPHMGVDYGAPAGTPVMAIGRGEVVSAAPNGGYGHQVVLRHPGGLESMYSHLSGYARGVRRGASVRQGQVIGYVGSTGLSTGPHLDFRIRRKGVFVDPTKVVNPRDEGVPANRRREFQAVVERCRAFMSGRRPLSEYDPAALAPPSSSGRRKGAQEDVGGRMKGTDAPPGRTKSAKKDGTPPKKGGKAAKKGGKSGKSGKGDGGARRKRR